MAKELARGISAQGRSKTYKRRGLWALKKKNGGQFPTHPKKEKPAPVEAKAPRMYPADDVKKPLQRRHTRRPTKLRSSITPGTVLILLAGRFKGKRVVFLSQLPSGLLLVTGPFSVNGVPLRRVNQAYVIATSTKLNVSKVDVSGLDDAYFKAPEKKERSKKGEDDFFEKGQEKRELKPEYIENQKKVDAAVTAEMEEVVKGYLKSRFTLHRSDRPHLMKF